MTGKDFLEDYDPQIKENGHENYTYTPEQVIERLNHYKKQLNLAVVVKSLPTIEERNNELSEMLENYYEDEEIELRKEFKFGFKHCFKWIHDKMSK